MGLFKILRAAAVHNNKSAGEREREGKEERERRAVGNVTDCLRKIDCQKMAGGAAKLKMPPAGNERERGGHIREVPAPEEHDNGGGLERPVWKAARPETSLPRARTSFP